MTGSKLSSHPIGVQIKSERPTREVTENKAAGHIKSCCRFKLNNTELDYAGTHRSES